MSVQVVPLVEADVPTFVRLELDAFESHPRTPIAWPRGYTDDLYAYSDRAKAESFRDSNCPMVKAVDMSSGRMLGAAEWTLFLNPAARAEETPTDLSAAPPSDWPREGNWPLRQWFKLEWQRWRRDAFKDQAYIVLDILVVDPASQGRGAGSKLLAWGCQMADKHCVPICLESTPAGLPLYTKFGFTEVRTLKADMKMFGWQAPYDEEAAKRVWMVRHARS